MARDPHADIPAQKLEVGLRESNITMADIALESADTVLDRAVAMFNGIPEPRDVVSTLIYVQAAAAAAGAIYQQVNVKLSLEYERAQVAHQRAHLDHAESAMQRENTIAGIRAETMNSMADKLREAGFDPQQMGGFGIIVPPNDDEGPNT